MFKSPILFHQYAKHPTLTLNTVFCQSQYHFITNLPRDTTADVHSSLYKFSPPRYTRDMRPRYCGGQANDTLDRPPENNVYCPEPPYRLSHGPQNHLGKWYSNKPSTQLTGTPCHQQED